MKERRKGEGGQEEKEEKEEMNYNDTETGVEILEVVS